MNWQITSLKQHSFSQWHNTWDELNDRYCQKHPFNDSRFVDALLRHFGQGNEQLCIHRSNNQIDGMLIMQPRRFGVWTQFSPSQTQMGATLLNNNDVLKTLFSATPIHVWMIELLRQDLLFSPLSLDPIDQQIRIVPHALTINIELSGEFNTYWEGRSKKLTQNTRRYQRRIIERFGPPQVLKITEPDQMCAALARYGELESSGWKGKNGTAIHAQNQQGLFYSEVLQKLAETGQANILEYWVSGQLAASRLLICNDNITVTLKTAYNESLAEFAPGRLLLKDLIEQEFNHKNSKSIEFYTNATSDQLSWATGQRHIYHAMIFRSALFAQLYDAGKKLKCVLKKNDPLSKTSLTPPPVLN